jgi:hypothetical protein
MTFFAKLAHPKPSYTTPEFLVDGLHRLRCQPTDPILKLLTNQLAALCLKNIPDLYVGQYNDHRIWLVINGSVLDPPIIQ